MTNSNVIKCSNCSLVNFSTALFCKRCRMPFHSTAENNQGQTVNININLQNPVDKININAPVLDQTNFQPQTRHLESPPNQQNDYPESYQPQNQTGFHQWQEMNAQMNPPQQMNPQAYNPSFPHPYQQPSGGIYRHGKEVVVHKNAMMPERCVKCNEQLSGYNAGGGFVRQKYRWHSPLIYIALISPIIYIILAAVLSKNATVDIPLCSNHLENKNITGKKLLVSGVGSVFAIFLLGSLGYAGMAFLIFFAAIIGLPLAYTYLYKPLQVSKIENDYVYLKGVSEEYISQLPYC